MRGTCKANKETRTVKTSDRCRSEENRIVMKRDVEKRIVLSESSLNRLNARVVNLFNPSCELSNKRFVNLISKQK